MRRKIFICVLLTLLNAAAFAQVRHFDFVTFDDPSYVYQFPRVTAGLSWENFKWAMTTDRLGSWYPLVWLSHMAACQFFGLNAGAHHLVNLGFHIAATVLLFLVFDSLTAKTWRAAIVAALFAVHPMHVESVAWISERKDVLSAPFFIATIGAYAAYARRRSMWRYAVVVLFFILTLMGKPMGMTLPAVLLLMDFWPLKSISLGNGNWGIGRREPFTYPRGGSPAGAPFSTDENEAIEKNVPLGGNSCAGNVTMRRLILEKIPLVAIALLSLVMTFHSLRSTSHVNVLPFSLRAENSILGYVRYLGKLFVPTHLAAVYPYPRSYPLTPVLAATVILLLITIVTLRLGPRRPYLPVGWLWFLGTLLPVVGFIQAGPQSMADRYTYIPAIGLFFAVVWFIAEAAERKPALRVVAISTAVVVIATFTLMAHHQAGYWINTETLFAHAADITEDNWVAHSELGSVYQARGDYDHAIREFAEAMRIDPGNSKNYCDIGDCFAAVDPARAMSFYETAVSLGPDDPIPHARLAAALYAKGDKQGALQQARRAIQLETESIGAAEMLRAIEAMKD